MFKNFLMKRMLKKQLANVPEAEQDKIINAVQSNPDFFTNIAKEVQEKVKGGKDQMAATMEVMQKHQEELKKIMGQ